MRRGYAGLIAVGLSIVACGGGPARVVYPVLPPGVRASVHRDHHHCRGREVRGLDLGGGRYEVLACGLDEVYVCPSGGYERGAGCYPESAGMLVAQPQPVQYIVVTGGGTAAAGAPVAAGAAGTSSAAGGTTTATTGSTATAATGTGATATTTAAAGAEASAGASSGGAGGSSPPPTMEQIQAAVGQWLDSNRTAILGCTHTAAALVEVHWTADGAMSVELGGEMHGTAGEQCVVAALANVRLNVAGQAGQSRHVVQ